MAEIEMADRLRLHFEALGGASSSEIYAEDAVLEFGHSGERLCGKANIDAVQRAYPGRPCSFDVHRAVCVADLGVVEMTLSLRGH